MKKCPDPNANVLLDVELDEIERRVFRLRLRVECNKSSQVNGKLVDTKNVATRYAFSLGNSTLQ